MPRGYDLIGDIHGCAHTLDLLLERLDYQQVDGVWQHPERQAIFLGDLVDRGPRIRGALRRVRAMVEGGHAHCILGNHELNALAWHTPALPGTGQTWVREHTPRHRQLIHETLAAFADHPGEWQDHLDWLYTLPLCKDFGHFRIVHACWDQRLIDELLHHYPDACIDEDFVRQSIVGGSLASRVASRLLNGVSLPLPHGLRLTGSDGYVRARFRTKFWESDPQTYGDVVFQPDALPAEIACEPLSDEEKAGLLCYGEDEPMLFVGHYWRDGHPEPLRPNLACLDYSAVKYGKLVAYRLDDERQIDPAKFVWIDVQREEGR